MPATVLLCVPCVKGFECPSRKPKARIMSVEIEDLLLHRTTPHRSERLPMQRRWTVLLQGGQMLRRAVALVRSQAVLGEDRVPLAHHAVAFDLGQNRSGRN